MGQLVQRIGVGNTMYIDFDFEWNERVVGFYGSETTDFIILLGIVYQDVVCTQQYTSAPQYRERADITRT